MDKYEDLANQIIDEVSNIIERHYKVKPKCITSDKSIINPALINGTVYYDLESHIAEKLRHFVRECRDD